MAVILPRWEYRSPFYTRTSIAGIYKSSQPFINKTYPLYWDYFTRTQVRTTTYWNTDLIEIIWLLIRNYSHLSKHFAWCNCPQRGSLRRLKSSSKQITHVDKICKTQKKTKQHTSVKYRNHTTKDRGVVSFQSGCWKWLFN